MTAEQPCVHHFLLEPPNGPTSKGVCKKCGLEREFNNSESYSAYDDALTAKQKKASAGVAAHRDTSASLYPLTFEQSVKALLAVPKNGKASPVDDGPPAITPEPLDPCAHCGQRPRLSKGTPYCSRECRKAAKEKRAAERVREAQDSAPPPPPAVSKEDYWQKLVKEQFAIEDLFEPEYYLEVLAGILHQAEETLGFHEESARGLRPVVAGLKETLARMRHAGVEMPRSSEVL